MTDTQKLGPWIRRFLLEHLIQERNLSRGTQRSYRDTLALLIPFVARQTRKGVEDLSVVHVSAEAVRRFLAYLENSRKCAISTRNQRLAAIHSLARFVALHSPEHLAWCGEICAIPFKKSTQTPVTYLEKTEIDALLAAPNLRSAQGRRDHLLLLFLYNTGARADEAAQVLVRDLNLAHVPSRDLSWVKIRGKGNKLRNCPLWPQTVHELQLAIEGREPTEHVFLNRYGRPITRFGVYHLVKRHVARVRGEIPSLARKDVSPHTIRHYVPFLTMSCNCSRAQYFRPLQEAGNDIVFIDPISPAGGNRSIVSGMFGSQKVLARALEDAPAGHIGPFARSLRKQGYTWDSIHGQVLRALWLGHERVGTPQIHLETPIAMKE